MPEKSEGEQQLTWQRDGYQRDKELFVWGRNMTRCRKQVFFSPPPNKVWNSGKEERNSPDAGTSEGSEPGQVWPTVLCVFDQERCASVEPPLALSDCGYRNSASKSLQSGDE